MKILILALLSLAHSSVFGSQCELQESAKSVFLGIQVGGCKEEATWLCIEAQKLDGTILIDRQEFHYHNENGTVFAATGKVFDLVMRHYNGGNNPDFPYQRINSVSYYISSKEKNQLLAVCTY